MVRVGHLKTVDAPRKGHGRMHVFFMGGGKEREKGAQKDPTPIVATHRPRSCGSAREPKSDPCRVL